MSLCRACSAVTCRARLGGRPLTTAGAWVAATAVLNGIPLVSYNRHDFVGVPDLVVLSAGAN